MYCRKINEVITNMIQNCKWMSLLIFFPVGFVFFIQNKIVLYNAIILDHQDEPKLLSGLLQSSVLYSKTHVITPAVP